MLDGTEISQFTYFQQVGGIDLSPISGEITYGLERIAMFLQKVDNVFDLDWGGGKKYGEVRHREEVEQSKYAFNQGTGIDGETFAAFHRSQFDANYAFAKLLLDGGLTLPALEFCLKCSHSSICSTRAAASASPSAPPTSCASGNWRSRSARRTSANPRRASQAFGERRKANSE